MEKNKPIYDHPFNDDPFAKRRYDPYNRSHEPGYADSRNDRFDSDYFDGADDTRRPIDADGFMAPMVDILEGGFGPDLERYSIWQDLPPEFGRALDASPEAKRYFAQLSHRRRQQIVGSLSRDSRDDRSRHVHSVIRRLIIEARKDVEIGIE